MKDRIRNVAVVAWWCASVATAGVVGAALLARAVLS